MITHVTCPRCRPLCQNLPLNTRIADCLRDRLSIASFEIKVQIQLPIHQLECVFQCRGSVRRNLWSFGISDLK